eukprot:GHVU01155102.1.p1 GENE.GHVU01155102.1~~GHVU01155102.1.p1  ORF type:complete len:164 (+),score=24.70 GHVU01155102.1:101-592(+)
MVAGEDLRRYYTSGVLPNGGEDATGQRPPIPGTAPPPGRGRRMRRNLRYVPVTEDTRTPSDEGAGEMRVETSTSGMQVEEPLSGNPAAVEAMSTTPLYALTPQSPHSQIPLFNFERRVEATQSETQLELARATAGVAAATQAAAVQQREVDAARQELTSQRDS